MPVHEEPTYPVSEEVARRALNAVLHDDILRSEEAADGVLQALLELPAIIPAETYPTWLMAVRATIDIKKVITAILMHCHLFCAMILINYYFFLLNNTSPSHW